MPNKFSNIHPKLNKDRTNRNSGTLAHTYVAQMKLVSQSIKRAQHLGTYSMNNSAARKRKLNFHP